MYIYRRKEDVCQWLTKKLGAEPRADIWNELVDERWVDEVLHMSSADEAGDALEQLVAHYRAQDKRFPAQRAVQARERLRRSGAPDEREDYIAKLVALEAAQDTLVVRFHSEVLGGQQLELNQVSEWVSARSSEDGEPTWFVEHVPLTWSEVMAVEQRFNLGIRPAESAAQAVILPAESAAQLGFDAHRRALEILMAEMQRATAAMEAALPGAVARALAGPSPWRSGPTGAAAARLVFLTCRLEEDTVVQPIAWGGTLHRLYDLGRYLASRFGWREEYATTFVLTGQYPIAYLYDLELRQNDRFPALEAVQLRFPYRLSPRDVATFYAEERHWLDPGRGNGSASKRDRPMTKKHLELAVFSQTHKSGTLKSKMESWNDEHAKDPPNWRYEHVTVFGRDIRSAYSRLTGKELPKKDQGKKGSANG